MAPVLLALIQLIQLMHWEHLVYLMHWYRTYTLNDTIKVLALLNQNLLFRKYISYEN